MTRREFLTLSAAALLAGSGGCRRTRTPSPPSIVILLIDQLRKDSFDRWAPRTAALARNGLRFEQMRAAAPWTYPSVLSLMSGLYPQQHGADGHARGNKLTKFDRRMPLLQTILSSSGYQNAAFVTNPFLLAQSEATFDYFEATRSYLDRYGKPVAFYSDRHSIFHVNARDKARRGAGLSQFGRALADLNIDIICANSPQAKGRVERANGTLQDRLVKELRLAGVSDMEQAGPVLEAFRLDYNRRFARLPRSERDAHRPLADHEDLAEVLTLQTERRITGELLLHYKRILYVIEDTVENRKLRGARATVSEHENGEVVLLYNGRQLTYRVHPKDNARIAQGSIVENKRLEAVLKVIAEQQQQRDRQRLSNPKITLREKARIRRAVTL